MLLFLKFETSLHGNIQKNEMAKKMANEKEISKRILEKKAKFDQYKIAMYNEIKNIIEKI